MDGWYNWLNKTRCWRNSSILCQLQWGPLDHVKGQQCWALAVAKWPVLLCQIDEGSALIAGTWSSSKRTLALQYTLLQQALTAVLRGSGTWPCVWRRSCDIVRGIIWSPCGLSGTPYRGIHQQPSDQHWVSQIRLLVVYYYWPKRRDCSFLVTSGPFCPIYRDGKTE